jgi:hypothetical protein
VSKETSVKRQAFPAPSVIRVSLWSSVIRVFPVLSVVKTLTLNSAASPQPLGRCRLLQQAPRSSIITVSGVVCRELHAGEKKQRG